MVDKSAGGGEHHTGVAGRVVPSKPKKASGVFSWGSGASGPSRRQAEYSLRFNQSLGGAFGRRLGGGVRDRCPLEPILQTWIGFKGDK